MRERVGTLHPEWLRENGRKVPVDSRTNPGYSRQHRRQFQPVVRDSNGSSNPLDILNENRNALCASLRPAPKPMLLTAEGRTQTQ